MSLFAGWRFESATDRAAFLRKRYDDSPPLPVEVDADIIGVVASIESAEDEPPPSIKTHRDLYRSFRARQRSPLPAPGGAIRVHPPADRW